MAITTKKPTRTPKPKGPPSSERNIYFYRMDAGITEGGKPIAVDIASVLKKVGSLDFELDSARLWSQPDDNDICAWVDKGTDSEHMRLATIRRSGLPRVAEKGVLSDLPVAATAGLYEPIHACFFPNHLVGVEFNFYGPRPSRIASYLRRAAGDATCPSFTLDPLLRQDVAEQLKRFDRLRLIDLKVRSSYAETVMQADQDLGAAFEAARRVGGAQVVHLVLQPEPHKRSWLGQQALTAVRNLAGRSDLRENALGFQVKGHDEPSDTVEIVDVLRDEVVASKKVVRIDKRSRALDPSATYAAIEEAYAELKPQLEAAAAAALA